MMASEELRDDETVVSTTDGRTVILHGPEELRHEIVAWWDRYKRLFENIERCPFCHMPMLPMYEDVRIKDARPIAHEDCAAEYEYQREVERRELELERRRGEEEYLPFPDDSDPGAV